MATFIKLTAVTEKTAKKPAEHYEVMLNVDHIISYEDHRVTTTEHDLCGSFVFGSGTLYADATWYEVVETMADIENKIYVANHMSNDDRAKAAQQEAFEASNTTNHPGNERCAGYEKG